MCTEFWRKSLRQGNHVQDLSVDGRTILKRIFKKWDGGALDCTDLAAKLVQMAGFRKHGNEPLVSMKYGQFLYHMRIG
jgi:hypothetical protein